MVPWPEPTGSNSVSTSTAYHVQSIFAGEKIYVKTRRFIVVQSWKSHCLAMRISTYRGQGLNKSGADPKHHAALVLKGEVEVRHLNGKMIRDAIHLIVEDRSQSIDPHSCIDFSRIYTLEYNVKVKTLGRVAPKGHQENG